MRVSEAQPGDKVTITGTIMKHHGPQTLLWVPGVGESGQWSVVNSAECEIVLVNEDPFVAMMLERWADDQAKIKELERLAELMDDGETPE